MNDMENKIAKQLQKLVKDMRELGYLMQLKNVHEEMAQHGRELINASVLAESWIIHIQENALDNAQANALANAQENAQANALDGVCNPVPNVLMLPLSLNHTRNPADGVTYPVRL